MPQSDPDRYRLMTSTEGVDQSTGLPNAPLTGVVGDQMAWCSIGPYLAVQAGNTIQATVAFAVQEGNYPTALQYQTDYFLYQKGERTGGQLFHKYPSLENGFRLGTAFDGDYGTPPVIGMPVPDLHGREWPLIAPPGFQFEAADCRDEVRGQSRTVMDTGYTWFDFDCDFCTGVYDYPTRTGLFHRPWTIPPSLLVDATRTQLSALRVSHLTPNPARAGSRMVIELPRQGHTSVTVYNVAGRSIADLADGVLSAGAHVVVWDGRDRVGQKAPAGLYFIRTKLEAETVVQKLTVVR